MDTFSYVREWKNEFEDKGWWHSFDLPDGRQIEGVCTVEGLRHRIDQYPIPQDLRGARVLDIGAWDGWYTFEMERRGADVVAVDCWNNPRFHQMREYLNSRADYRLLDFYELTPETVGQFDIVLFMGVLYHLKHPLLALERVCALTKDLAVVDSFILREEHRPGENVENRSVMEFYEIDEFGGQTDNWCGPSLPCLMAMCRTAGFARVEHRATLPNGACLACYRTWDPAPRKGAPAPQLLDAFHHTNFGVNFSSKRDDYVTVTFDIDAERPEVQPQVGSYGVRPIHIGKSGSGHWQTHFKLPPGLAMGWHDVTIGVNGIVSNPGRIAVDLPLESPGLRVEALCDGTSWEKNALDLHRGNVLSVWVAGLPSNADKANVRARVNGTFLPILYVAGGLAETRQINVQFPPRANAGDYEIEIFVGDTAASPVRFKVTGNRL